MQFSCTGWRPASRNMFGHVLHAAEDFGRDRVFVVARLEAHDADEFGAEPLHARDAALDLGERDVEGVVDLSWPSS